MSWKPFALGIGVIVATGVAGAAPAPFDVRLDEPKDRTAETIRWPVTVGVPFANGAITSDTPLTLTDANGKPMPLQTKTLGEWRVGAKTPKWILLDFQTSLRRAAAPRFRVVAGLPAEAGGKPAAAPNPIQVKETPETISVDTGAVAFSVSKKNFNLLDTMSLSDGTQVLKGSSVYWVRDDGRRYETRPYGQSSVVLETPGPLRTVIRAEGWYATAAKPDDPMMRYQVRITAFAGLPYVRIYHTFIWTQDDSVLLKELGLSFFPSKELPEKRVGVAGEPPRTVAGNRIEAVQDQQETGFMMADGAASSLKQLSGWAELRDDKGGFAVSLKDLANMVPKAFTLVNDRLDVQFWAPQAGLMNLELYHVIPAAHVDTLRKATKRMREWEGYNVPSPQGAAITHEVWIWPTAPKSAPVEAVNDLVQRPVVAMADPVYQCSTDAIPYLRPKSATPAKYQRIEQGLDAMFRHVAAPVLFIGERTMWSFGDVDLFDMSPWRPCEDGGFNWPAVPWMMFYRSGERDYFEAGMRNARHVMDVDCCHHGAKNDAQHSNPPYTKVVGWTYQYASWHWAWGPLWDVWWTHPEYLLYCYDLTGYERAGDVLQEMADANSNPPGGDPAVRAKDRSSVSREVYGGIGPKAVYYEFAGNPAHLKGGKYWADVAVLAQAPEGRFANNLFAGWLYVGLDAVHRFNDDPGIKNALLKTVKEFAQPPASPLEAGFWGTDCMQPFAFAYRVTGNEAYLRYPIWYMRQQAAITQLEGEVLFNGGIGYTSPDRMLLPAYMVGGMNCLGAWADTGYKDLGEWPGNNPYFAPHTIKDGDFITGATIFVKKEEKKAGTLLIAFKQDNLMPCEQFVVKDKEKEKHFRLEIRITGPDAKQRVIPVEGIQKDYNGSMFWVGPDPVPVPFAADDPAGEYRVEIVSEQQMFWISPRTDLPGLVVSQPEGRISFELLRDPGKYYLRLKPDATRLDLRDLGGMTWYGRPVGVVAATGEVLHLFSLTDPATISVEIPAPMRDKPIALVKGPVYYNIVRPPAGEGVIAQGVYDFVAVNADQWFLPTAAK